LKKQKYFVPSNDIPNDEKILDFDKFLEEIYRFNEDKTNDNVLSNFAENKLNTQPILKKSNMQTKTNFILNNKIITKFLEKTKSKKRKLNSNKKNNSDIYNINNFVVQTNNSNRIVQKSMTNFEIKIPQFVEIEEFDNVDELTSDEDISDDIYLAYHNQYEQREKDYKIRFFSQDKKKTKKVTNKVDATNVTESSDSNFKIRINLELSPSNFEIS
jgi:hypothetical protein